jgi:hypothetical protein
MDDFADARFAKLFLSVDAGFAEVLGNDDVGGELRPAGGDFGAFHFEDDRAIGVIDDARAAFPDDFIERVDAFASEATIECKALRARNFFRFSFGGGRGLRCSFAYRFGFHDPSHGT